MYSLLYMCTVLYLCVVYCCLEGNDSEATWLGHRLQFEREPTKPTSEGVEEPDSLPLDASALSGAQASEQFYALDDPRNPLNVRRREAGGTAAGRAQGTKREDERREHSHHSSSKHSKHNWIALTQFVDWIFFRYLYDVFITCSIYTAFTPEYYEKKENFLHFNVCVRCNGSFCSLHWHTRKFKKINLIKTY